MSKKVYRVRAKYLDSEGRGVVSFNHSMIPVPGLLVGELAEIELVRKKDETLGRIVNVIEKVKDRVEDVCPYVGICGGCQLWHMSYEKQLEYKQEQVKALMGQYGDVPLTIGMETPVCYRHKIHSTLGRDGKGKVISGIYAKGTHKLVSIDHCGIQDSVADDIMQIVRTGMKKLGIAPYDEDKRKGLMRHVLIKTGAMTGEIMVVFVLANLKFPQGKALCDMLIKKYPKGNKEKNKPWIRTIVYNLNDKKTSMVLGDDEKVMFGEGFIEDKLCGMTFRISPKSFYQVNPIQTEKLYTTAIEMANICQEDTVLDTYCGIGTITLLASKYAKQVIGVELNPDAVKDARMNAKLNNIKNVHFIGQDATKYMKEVVNLPEVPSFDVIIMDPPRSGSTKEFMQAAVKLAPKRIVYISCNPVTQKRDMEILVKQGYKVKGIQPLDMFPMTVGIENIIVFEK